MDYIFFFVYNEQIQNEILMENIVALMKDTLHAMIILVLSGRMIHL